MYFLPGGTERLGFYFFFAGSYAALYTRFSSQYRYLSDTYNAIKAAETRCSEKVDTNDPLNEWKAGFIEDVINLHLLHKPVFSTVVYHWLNKEDVKKKYDTQCGKLGPKDLRTSDNILYSLVRKYPSLKS